MTMLRIPILVGIVLAAARALAETSPPPPPRPALEQVRLIDVELKDGAGGPKAIRTRFELAVSGSGATSTISSTVGETAYVVKLRHGVAGGTYLLEIARHEVRRGPALSAPDLDLTAERTLQPDRREVVGVIARPDGISTEVALTMR